MRCYVERVITESDVQRDIKELITDAGMRRRMSRILKVAVSTAIECIGGRENIEQLNAIITATGLGCLADSERFLRNMVVDKEQLLNPTPFIQSTFNTIGGQIALLGHNHCYNVTYVNRGHSFEDAMLDAMISIADGDASRVLVGAFDEETPTQHHILERMGAWRKMRSGEGAVFALLDACQSDRSVAQVTLIEFPQQSLTEEECFKRYATRGDAQLLYNTIYQSGIYPTASARSFAEAVRRVECGIEEVIIYNEFLGATPTVLRVECVG